MLTISDAAGAHLAQILVQAKVSDTEAVRCVLDGTKLSIQLDEVCPDDVVCAHEARTVLVLDAEVSHALSDRPLDVDDADDDGPECTLREARSCARRPFDGRERPHET